MSATPLQEVRVGDVGRSGVDVVAKNPTIRSVSAVDDLERIVLGDPHFVRRRLDATLDRIGCLLRGASRLEAWEDVERATRLAFRGLTCAVAAVPPQARIASLELIRVGPLEIDVARYRQWWGSAESELSPLRHSLLARLAQEPYLRGKFSGHHRARSRLDRFHVWAKTGRRCY